MNDRDAFLRNLRQYDPNPEGDRDSGGNPIATVRYITTARLQLKLKPRGRFGAALGGSVLRAQIDRVSYADGYADGGSPSYVQAGADLDVRLGPIGVYVEYFKQIGPAVRDADYVLGGLRAEWKMVRLRVNTSWVRYHLGQDIDELMIQPGVTITVGGGLAFFLEYDEWLRRDVALDPTGGWSSHDRSLNLVLAYTY